MKILYVFEHFHPYIGGAEELFLGLASSLAQKGHDITVVTTLHDKSLPREEIFNGFRIERVNCHNRFLFTLFSLPKILRLARQSDLIHTASYNAAVPAFLAGLFCNKKVLITFHEVWGKLWFRLPFKSKPLLAAYYCYEKLILKLPFHKYIAVSQFTFDALKSSGIPEKKIRMIYNGMDYMKFKQFSHHPPGNFTYCFFGRLGISKGLEILLVASQKFSVIHPETIFKLIIPTYPVSLYKKVLRMIADKNLQGNILVMHDLDKKSLFEEITSSSCVIIPSYSEGFCFTATETTALRVPVISSGMGSLKEVIGGKHIHLKELTITNLLEAMERAYRNDWDDAAEKIFTLQKSVESYEKLYSEIV